MLTTNQKGAIAETAIVHKAVRLGIDVYRPVAEGSRCDLIFLVGDCVFRVQCKWVVRRGAVIPVPCYSSTHGSSGFRKHRYTTEEIDAIAAYCAELDRCFFLPLAFFADRTAIQLRLGPTRNGQRAGVIWADDLALERLH